MGWDFFWVVGWFGLGHFFRTCFRAVSAKAKNLICFSWFIGLGCLFPPIKKPEIVHRIKTENIYTLMAFRDTQIK